MGKRLQQLVKPPALHIENPFILTDSIPTGKQTDILSSDRAAHIKFLIITHTPSLPSRRTSPTLAARSVIYYSLLNITLQNCQRHTISSWEPFSARSHLSLSHHCLFPGTHELRAASFLSKSHGFRFASHNCIALISEALSVGGPVIINHAHFFMLTFFFLFF